MCRHFAPLFASKSIFELPAPVCVLLALVLLSPSPSSRLSYLTLFYLTPCPFRENFVLADSSKRVCARLSRVILRLRGSTNRSAIRLGSPTELTGFQPLKPSSVTPDADDNENGDENVGAQRENEDDEAQRKQGQGHRANSLSSAHCNATARSPSRR